jgi:hypothetical protein
MLQRYHVRRPVELDLRSIAASRGGVVASAAMRRKAQRANARQGIRYLCGLPPASRLKPLLQGLADTSK